VGRRSPHSLYDQPAGESVTNLELFENQWAQGVHVAVGIAGPVGGPLAADRNFGKLKIEPLQAYACR